MREITARNLLAWYAGAARQLPWRLPFPRDPYQVLVSELMAQQTQIARVLGAFATFVERFPSLEALASAREDEVVHAWTGLGYYRRARQLHRAARAIVEAGRWPTELDSLRRLPGVGPYTAAAIAAFCFGGAVPLIDGNVARVTARVEALELEAGSAALTGAARKLAARLHERAPEPALFEALMELGARVCTPVSPRCGACPLREDCQAAALDTPERFPLPRRSRPIEALDWVALWLARADGRILLRRVEGPGVLAGLWLPPFVETGEMTRPEQAAADLAHELGVGDTLAAASPVRHSITHRRIHVIPFVAHISGARTGEGSPGMAWELPGAPTRPTSSLLGKLALVCNEGFAPRLPLADSDH